MKKYFLIFGLLNFIFSSAQCTIIGADQLQVGEKQIYSVENAAVDCTDCYQWSYLDQKIILESDPNKIPLTLKGSVPGDATLSLAVKSAEGFLKCSKLIKVIAPISNILDLNAPKCTIATDAFKEVRIADHVVIFEPNTTEPDSSYKWIVTYRNRTKKESVERLGKFDFASDNVIDNVELVIAVKECTKKISKTYDTNFWWFF